VRSDVAIEGQYSPVPRVLNIRHAILRNDNERPSVAWGEADFSRLSSDQIDALQMVLSSVLSGEVHGRDIYAHLLAIVPYRDISDAYAAQILDENFHSRLLTRYLREEMHRPVLEPLLLARYAIRELLRLRDPLIATLAASLFVECTAAEMVAELMHKVKEPLAAQVLQVILRDEARHKALGREAALFLLETPPYKRRWAREKAKLYRFFNEHYCRFLFSSYGKFTQSLDFDAQAVHRRAMAAIHEAVPL
jgi:rubrerythrin